MFDPGQQLALRGTVALQLIRDNHPRHVLQPLEQRAEKLLRRVLVALALPQEVEEVVLLSDRAPQGMPFGANWVYLCVSATL
jgi:hypothetical protein